MRLHDDPTISDIIGALLATIAVGATVYLAITGSASAQTALVGLVGAASGTYFASRVNSKNGGPPPPAAPASSVGP